MSTKQAIPFNISILELTPGKLEGLKPVRVLDIFDGNSGNFNEDGLFSPSIFGKIGTELRMERFSYIDIKLPVFHPVIYNTIIKLKGLYEEIITGNGYATWNAALKDFERSDAVNGKTGFSYFLKYWKDIKHVNTGSTLREEAIKLLEMYKDKALVTKVVVIPAGLRDVEIGNSGRVSQDDINKEYARLLSIANTINENVVKANPDLLDVSRLSLQRAFIGVYSNLEARLEGKHKHIMGKWASRRIMNGTANVITALDVSTAYLGDKGNIGYKNTAIGMYQAMKSILPVSIHLIKTGFLSKVFINPNMPVTLINKKTLKSEQVSLPSIYHDRYATDEGIEKVITAFNDIEVRNLPLEINGYYVGLLYRGPDGTFKIIQDIDSVPKDRNKADVTPLTFGQLLYISIYKTINTYPLMVTRYPITGIGSIYPSFMFVKSTIKYEKRRELGDGWEPLSDEYVAYQFPTDGQYLNSLVPHTSRLIGLSADYDGDRSSGNATYSIESKNEIASYLTKKRAYVGTDGRFTASASTSTSELVFFNMTGDD